VQSPFSAGFSAGQWEQADRQASAFFNQPADEDFADAVEALVDEAAAQASDRPGVVPGTTVDGRVQARAPDVDRATGGRGRTDDRPARRPARPRWTRSR
jgi:hypothetical protein